MDEATSGVCECGCGRATGIARQTDRKYGWTKGQPVRFIPGHNQGGMAGDQNPQWKGDAAGYGGIHRWLRTHYAKSGLCDQCHEAARTHFALIHGRQYSRNRADYRELCPRCHAQYDLTGQKHAPGVDAKKLTDDIAREIIRMRAQGATYRSIAETYGVSIATAWNVANGKTWAHVQPLA